MKKQEMFSRLNERLDDLTRGLVALNQKLDALTRSPVQSLGATIVGAYHEHENRIVYLTERMSDVKGSTALLTFEVDADCRIDTVVADPGCSILTVRQGPMVRFYGSRHFALIDVMLRAGERLTVEVTR